MDAQEPLFEAEPALQANDDTIPLAERMRPRTLDEVAGQAHLLAPGKPLRVAFESGRLHSMILWGPPGVGKTTLARLMAGVMEAEFVVLSAVLAGVKDIRDAVERAKATRRAGRATIVFVDEVHRFNKAQQDAFLPHVESGLFTFIGATTENPSFEVVAPLLSRCRVFVLRRLEAADLAGLVQEAARDDERGLGAAGIALPDAAASTIAEAADGDARRALGVLETAVALARRAGAREVGDAELREAAGRRALLYDRDREQHYDVISAFIKSLRASDPDAALYWLARMLEAGEDPRFIARRLAIFASEDVGNAAPEGLALATSAYLAVERIGLPEGRIPLAHATTFLACAPKSNASYAALGRAEEAVRRTGSAPVPLHLRNAPTPLLRELGYGAAYRTPHAEPDAFVAARNLPDALGDATFYEPSERGAEREIAERLRAWRRRREER
jgi:putative ATPase